MCTGDFRRGWCGARSYRRPQPSRVGIWWSGDRPQVDAWRAAGFTLSELQLGETVTFSRAVTDKNARLVVEVPSRAELKTVTERSEQAADVDLVLITCEVEAGRAGGGEGSVHLAVVHRYRLRVHQGLCLAAPAAVIRGQCSDRA
ncbi:DUF7662 domain-containing protein [Rhodococcus rhodochrous]|uniref:DUF7662 domain-containing protein n=1 Tax=Rhodococcus rhodochrous TaxID=1829 RepID=UPI003FD8DFC6